MCHATDDSYSEDSKKLDFYCRDCDARFESEPDGTGYEQAPCPRCRHTCMTVQFEQEEQRRHSGEAMKFFSLLGVPDWLSRVPEPDPEQSATQNDVEPTNRLETELTITDPVAVATFDDRAEAGEFCQFLEQGGIESRLMEVDATNCFVPNVTGGVVLQVAARHCGLVREILQRYQSSRSDHVQQTIRKDSVSFQCEECGATVSFPGYRRGNVEICRNCGQYVDVPE